MSDRMVFDRTQEDVYRARDIYENKVKMFVPLSDSDIAAMERGCLTINVLNRIESKQEEIRSLINAMGYHDTPITTKSWSDGEFFFKTDIERWRSNLDILKKAFFVFSETPQTPKAKYSFQQINDFEKILYDLEQNISIVQSHYKECGTVYCGEVVS